MKKFSGLLLLVIVFQGCGILNVPMVVVEEKAVVEEQPKVVSTTVSDVAPTTIQTSISLQKPVHNFVFNKELTTNQKAAAIDSVWIEKLYSSPLYNSEDYVIADTDLDVGALNELPTTLLKERLEFIDSNSPFHVEYNPILERVIKTYLKRRRKYFPNLMARAEYYFPMFEEHLDKYDIPLEIKYLAIVESALDPRAKSRVGATGLWQFMYQTGKQFGLKTSSYVDEREDPVKATKAACKYLENLYNMFGDWDLALAAYNSGPGNVTKAIRRSGGYKNYWNIRPYLPQETAGYLPAFYATMYLFEYAKEHELIAKKPVIPYFDTDTLQIKRTLTFEQLSRTLNVDIKVLQFLNPEYKLDIIPFVKGRNYTVRLPKKATGKFVENEEAIYLLAQQEEAKREKPLPKYFEMNQRIRYRVRNGDYLGKIANRYGVRVSQIKKWNRLRSNNLKIGQRLTIYPKRLNFTVAKKGSKSTKRKPAKKGKYTTYVVKRGDSLWSISKKYSNVSMKQIKEWNNIWSVKSLKPGTKLKIYNL